MPLLATRAAISQEEPRDAVVNFDMYRILQRHRAVSLQQHGLLYKAATVEMLKLGPHIVR